jgi:hypothetical protein
VTRTFSETLFKLTIPAELSKTRPLRNWVKKPTAGRRRFLGAERRIPLFV